MFEAWDEYDLIDGGLVELTERLPASGLGEVIRYVLRSPGKRVRPLILILSSEAFGCEPRRSLNAALAMELVHAASLVHDDILDGGTERRGGASAFHKYGMEAALLCGDYLISRSIGLFSGYSREVIEAFSAACMDMSEGEMLDLEMRKGPEDYYLCISKKTASLISASSKIGCMIAGASGEDVALFERYGTHLGLAYQVADDLNEFLGMEKGKSSEKSSVTLPVIYRRNHSAESTVALCSEAIRDHCRAAKEALAEAGGDEEIKERLGSIVDRWGEECKSLKDRC
ncbi:polyprenyl synthetase family protein [Methanotrichaceae archaeon M04Ac]|uniref:Polyprenyl synthetase family protein n=1 Tax=Candidatus Methanocrinis alkalitolerans TaxID=3033395 RepID=A0ABT5XFL2_9EURY|nr:polyprenyl synthetase family protein [Candidatus Methanocrinis alkalitolerans]MCR3883080.1 polyprenyl synthetase family protein [Methanothrix sp.]MDF0593462.1 polyprenyl synthetase family protein [Candidatus Methanocrinis alkalitolerans]